ncbi:leucine dehydrogenase [bacterium]|nr:leucine dehydrogenase [bacterium]
MDLSFYEIIQTMGHEQVLICQDLHENYCAIFALHNTRLGPAIGGTRLWRYDRFENAMTDALRLSRGMTYKCAMAGIPFGGGKSVIIADGNTIRREPIFKTHGKFVERLGGHYITAEDVGTSPADMAYVRTETRHVAGLAEHSGDPSPWTAKGVVYAMKAAARFRWGNDELRGKIIAIQGCGHVGYYLAKELHFLGAKLIVTDIDQAKIDRCVKEFDAIAVKPDAIYTAHADIFAPCALGGIINEKTLPQLRVEIVCGAANNQLQELQHGQLIHQLGIVYVPDYIANAGGIINGCREMLGWELDRMLKKLEGIFDTTLRILNTSQNDHIPPQNIADQMVEKMLNSR